MMMMMMMMMTMMMMMVMMCQVNFRLQNVEGLLRVLLQIINEKPDKIS